MSLVNIANVSMNIIKKKKKTYQGRYFVSYISKQLVLFVLLPMSYKRRCFYNCVDSDEECSTISGLVHTAYRVLSFSILTMTPLYYPHPLVYNRDSMRLNNFVQVHIPSHCKDRSQGSISFTCQM